MGILSTPSPDRRALKILNSRYWSAAGWVKDPVTPPDDLAYAKAAGLMFDPKHVDHDGAVEWAIRSRAKLSHTQVTDAFLASLTTRRLEWRSALGSFAVSLNMAAHRFLPSAEGSCACFICGGFDRTNRPEDLNVLNFERFKWGGVRHSNPVFIGFDLEQFLLATPSAPTAADLRIMRDILVVARSLPANGKLKNLTNTFAKTLPSNDAERRTLVGILGFCGILRDPTKAGFMEGFPPFMERKEVPWYKNDWPYPVQWWNASHGICDEAVRYWFPSL